MGLLHNNTIFLWTWPQPPFFWPTRRRLFIPEVRLIILWRHLFSGPLALGLIGHILTSISASGAVDVIGYKYRARPRQVPQRTWHSAKTRVEAFIFFICRCCYSGALVSSHPWSVHILSVAFGPWLVGGNCWEGRVRERVLRSWEEEIWFS